MSYLPLIQARMDSTRLPGKVMLPICGRPILAHVVDACNGAGLSPTVVTPHSSVNDPIREWCREHSVNCSTWPVPNVRDPLAEFTYAVRQHGAYMWVIRLTADCPMLEAHHVSMFASMLKDSGTFYTNRPADMDGFDLEGFTVARLRTQYLIAEGADREHICTGMYAHRSQEVRRFSVMGNPHTGEANGKLSVDTQEEYERVRELMEEQCR